jgi:hypothetical protein
MYDDNSTYMSSGSINCCWTYSLILHACKFSKDVAWASVADTAERESGRERERER